MKKIFLFIIILALIIPLIVITVSNIVTIFGYLERGYEFEKIPLVVDTVERLTAWKNLVWLVLAILLVLIFFSLIIFAFKRIKCYIRLCSVCSKEGYKFKLKRFPLASLFGVKNKEDISIICGDKKYLIHFVDVVGRARVFTLIDDRTYEVSKTGSGDISQMPLGAARIVSTDRVILKGRRKRIPEFDENAGEHIILLDPPTMEVRYIDSIPKPLFSGYSVGNITYYEANGFIKLLKRI